MMHAYLVGDPAKENKMDFTGFMAGYTKFFGTKEQPNKPARSAMQVAALAAPGALVEIEVIAVRAHTSTFRLCALHILTAQFDCLPNIRESCPNRLALRIASRKGRTHNHITPLRRAQETRHALSWIDAASGRRAPQ